MNELAGQVDRLVEKLESEFGQILINEAHIESINAQIIPNILVNFAGKTIIRHARGLNLTKTQVLETMQAMCDALIAGIEEGYDE